MKIQNKAMGSLRLRTSIASIIISLAACLGVLCVAMVGVQCAHAAALTVSSTADSGAGTLRAALASAANGDTIDATGISGTILLTTGELLVSNSVVITGPGPANLAVDGGGVSRVFRIESGRTVTISSLTITNGRSEFGIGGCIYNDHSTLTVSNCILSGNSANADGGAIYNRGSFGSVALTIINSILSGNSGTQGGGIYNDGTSSGRATLMIINSTLSDNAASTGGGIHNNGIGGSATLVVINSTLSRNRCSNVGGGIFNIGAAMIYCSTLKSNLAQSDGGGIFNSGAVTITNSTLSGNSAGQGGGIYNNGRYSGKATLEIVNSTLSGNSVTTTGAGIYNDGSFSGSATLMILNSTLSGNSDTFGGGAGIVNDSRSSGSATLKIGGALLNARASGKNIVSLGESTVISFGYNLSSDDGSGFLTATGDQINTDPMIGPLQDNGGPTSTHALLSDSPAIDQGKNLSASSTAQRGFPRTLDIAGIANAAGGDGTDIGAIESQDAHLRLRDFGIVSGQYGFNLIGPFSQIIVEASTNLRNWTPLATNTLGDNPLRFNDPIAPALPRFYRARVQ
jgi:hypothetical protein